MKKILVPVDFSETSVTATEFAVALAEKQEASLVLFHSVHIDYYSDYQFSTFSGAKVLLDDIYDARIKDMEDFVKIFNTTIQIETKISDDSMIQGIQALVEKEGIDLVVMGTHGSSGMAEVFVGSNTEKAVRRISCPIISVPKGYELNRINRILVPIDLREVKESFLMQVKLLQDQFQAKVEFLWVKTPHNIENEEEVTSELGKTFDSLGITDFDFSIVKNVFPSDGILDHAENTGVDIIAIATHARRGISHWLSGSLTEDIVNHIKIPVWTFKLNKKEKSLNLSSVSSAKGIPEYRKIEILAT